MSGKEQAFWDELCLFPLHRSQPIERPKTSPVIGCFFFRIHAVEPQLTPAVVGALSGPHGRLFTGRTESTSIAKVAQFGGVSDIQKTAIRPHLVGAQFQCATFTRKPCFRAAVSNHLNVPPQCRHSLAQRLLRARESTLNSHTPETVKLRLSPQMSPGGCSF